MKPIKGHGLLNEGDGFLDPPSIVLSRPWMCSRGSVGWAVCRCGASSQPLPSNAARKRWHREHKQSVLDASSTP